MVSVEPRALVFANEALQQLWGRPAAALAEGMAARSLRFPEWTHPDDREIVDGAAQPQGWGHALTYRIVHPDGSVRWVRDRIIELHGAAGTVEWLAGIAEDVTRERESVRDVREWQERWHHVLLAAKMVAVEWSASTGRMQLSGSVRDVLGISAPDDVPTLAALLAGTHPDDLPQLQAHLLSALQHGTEIDATFRHLRADTGAVVHIECRGRAQVADGQLTRLHGILTDVTERRRSEIALHQSEQLFRSLTENSTELITIVGADGRVRYTSPSITQVLGFRPDQRVGHYTFDLIHPDDRRIAEEVFLQIVAGAPRSAPFVVRMQDSDGGWRSIEFVARNFLEDAVIGGIAVNGRDISGRVEAEAQLREREQELRHAQKMEAMGQLAGGVAHDFNNLLTAITSYAEMLIPALPAKSQAVRDAEEIKKAGFRAASLTRQLLAFSRRQVMQLQLLDFNETIVEAKRMVERLIGEDVTVLLRLAQDLPLVRADPGQIDQVVVNLAVNARDAMPSGGTLIISTGVVTIDAERAAAIAAQAGGSFTPLKAAPYVVLEVQDTGTGMTQEVQARMFEPFFTTKEPGRGTGLGLSTVYGIIAQSGGGIHVDSAPGCGTTFRIYLPAVERSACDVAPMSYSVKDARGTETILIVEDEDAVRSVAVRALTRLGYQVLDASNGLEALHAIERRSGDVDLVITDLVMPEMSGTAFVERIRQRGYSPAVLLMSGYSEDRLLQQGEVPFGMSFLAKPFSLQELGVRVRSILDAQRVKTRRS